MLSLDRIDETISSYYDREMNISEKTKLEARLANSDYVKEYLEEKCYDFYKISSSIARVKNHAKDYSVLLGDEILNKNRDKLFCDGFNRNALKKLVLMLKF